MRAFSLKPTIVFEGGIDAVMDRMRRIFLVTDPFMVKSGRASYVTDHAAAAGRPCEVFSDISADPDFGVVIAGVQRLLAFEPDTVICLGGGAAIDAAKAMVLVAERAGYPQHIYFVAIPTTSGTGSEVTNFSVITDREKAVKYPLIDDRLLPDAAILDAELTLTVPPAVTADTGLDVLTHAVEAFVSTRHSDFADGCAEKAIKLVHHYLPVVFREPDNRDARQRMHNASCLAGIAFTNAGLGLNHGMAHALGARFHIPHGRANGILLPYVTEFNAGDPGAAERYAKIAYLLEISGVTDRQSVRNLVRTMRQYQSRLKTPPSIRAAGVDADAFEEAVPVMAAAAVADSCTASNPRPVTEEQAAELFRKAYQGS